MRRGSGHLEVKGSPTAEEIAALVVVLSARAQQARPVRLPEPAAGHRSMWMETPMFFPTAWRAPTWIGWGAPHSSYRDGLVDR